MLPLAANPSRPVLRSVANYRSPVSLWEGLEDGAA